MARGARRPEQRRKSTRAQRTAKARVPPAGSPGRDRVPLGLQGRRPPDTCPATRTPGVTAGPRRPGDEAHAAVPARPRESAPPPPGRRPAGGPAKRDPEPRRRPPPPAAAW